ncbi:LPS assembly lipoprotein LptE [Hyphobacterium indicum]|uniref:LPS assembly lipoprotein LptE n=1 Tax=Hyphobacterium indicum TaxID=2162714 RepID=UPI000D6536D6|nr:LPS assembly lipoprotein LptE [Hyphobacterium indicum]
MKRNAVLVLMAGALMGLSACAFQPLHGSPQQIRAMDGIVVAVDGQTRIDQILDEALNDRFGTPSGGRYRLAAVTSMTASGLGVGADDVATRSAISLTVDFSLIDAGSGLPVLTETVRAEATVDIPQQPYAAISARRDAEERAASQAADRIALRVARYINRGGQ